MSLTVRDFRLGVDGLQDGLQTVGEMVAKNMRDRRVIAWARRAMWEAGLPVNAMPSDVAQAIYRKQREDMTFAQDPYFTELMVSAVKLLCLDPAEECLRAGDCDDNVIVLAAALMSVGIPVRLLVRQYPHMDLLHLMIQYDADPLKRGAWTCFDATSPTGACFSGHTGEIVANLEVGPMIVEQHPPQLMVLGAPPFLGAAAPAGPTPGAAQLSDAQAAAWLTLLAQTRDRLGESLGHLLDATGELDAVRSDLGMPQVDPAPAPEATSGSAATSPIETYAHSFTWTAAAQNAQAKLVQTSTFLWGVMDDAIKGRRPLYWNNGDLFVGALDGDAYGVLMKPTGGAGSPLAPQYVDLSSGAATGGVGFGAFPIIVGIIGVAVLSIAAVYAVTKIVDYLAGAHREDTVGKIAQAQQALVASGQQTPEQAAAFMRATADAVSAPPPGGGAGVSVGWLIAAAFGGALLGVLGATVGPKLLSTRLSLGPA